MQYLVLYGSDFFQYYYVLSASHFMVECNRHIRSHVHVMYTFICSLPFNLRNHVLDLLASMTLVRALYRAFRWKKCLGISAINDAYRLWMTFRRQRLTKLQEATSIKLILIEPDCVCSIWKSAHHRSLQTHRIISDKPPGINPFQKGLDRFVFCFFFRNGGGKA